MAKRRSKGTGKSKVKILTNYQDERFVPYLMGAETRILQLDTTNTLIDGQVREALKTLIRSLEQTDSFYAVLKSIKDIQQSTTTIEVELTTVIIEGLAEAFDDYGQLSAVDTIGVLKVINRSIGNMTKGLNGRGYLTFLRGFMSRSGIEPRPLTVAEQKMAGLFENDKEALEDIQHRQTTRYS
ncbi:hypothetical protein QUF64_10540 [Anaerolineales bacterium HSG6]|nr:hypothetical protein [Anaerolineales bacterium HSG6]